MIATQRRGEADAQRIRGRECAARAARQGIEFSPMRDSIERGVPIRPEVTVA
ncbi:MAG TPA: hypothetical protein VF188_11140 [Longimicrobiales bacterium]